MDVLVFFDTATHYSKGFPMYIASSAFARHTLNALYSDLHLVLQKVALEDPRVSGTGEPSPESKRRREKSLTVVFSVHGNARVSGAEGRWDVYVVCFYINAVLISVF